jgi:hypothetical protein
MLQKSRERSELSIGRTNRFRSLPRDEQVFRGCPKGWMLSFRVRDLDKMAAQLEAAGIAVKIDPQSYPNGRFAHRMTLREIRSNCGNPQSQTLHTSLLTSNLP